MSEPRKPMWKSYAAVVLVVAIGGLIAAAGATHSTYWAGLPVFALAVGLAYLAQWVAFVPAYLRRTEEFFDLMGGGTYFAVTLLILLTVRPTTVGQWIIGALILIWSFRLASFLFRRVMKTGADGRFNEIKRDPARFFTVWTVQGLWISLTAGAGWAALTSAQTQPSAFHVIALTVGALVWVGGFTFEHIADKQKSAFKADPRNAGQFISKGLWARSRHPNYFGEITLWLGIAIMATPYLHGAQFILLVSPVFVFVLLRFVSGVPLLETRADAKWGKEPSYARYKKQTPLLVPRLRKISID